MAIFSLLTQTFDVPETSKAFLESYVDRVRNYISRNHLDSSLLEDLLERLAEKLFDASATEDSITEKNMLDIVNSL
jgi:arginine deiminase